MNVRFNGVIVMFVAKRQNHGSEPKHIVLDYKPNLKSVVIIPIINQAFFFFPCTLYPKYQMRATEKFIFFVGMGLTAIALLQHVVVSVVFFVCRLVVSLFKINSNLTTTLKHSIAI